MTGCGQDPIEQRAAELASQGGSSTPVAAPPPQPGTPQPGGPQPSGPGIPEEPAPGVPDEPPPGQPLGGDGPQITVSGTVSIAEWSGAPIRVDIFDGDQRNLEGPRPSVVGVARLDAPGPWTLTVSAATAQLWVGAYADDNRDGKPDHSEPVGWHSGNPLAGGTDRTGIDITLSVQPPE